MAELSEETWRRIARLLSGELSEGEAARVRTDLEDDPETREALRRAEEIWTRAGDVGEGGRARDAEEDWTELSRRLDLGPDGRSDAAPRSVDGDGAPGGLWRWGRWAAAALILAAAGYWMMAAGDRPGSGEVGAGVDGRTYTTRRAEQSTVRLSDGTVVEMAPASRLTVPAGYGERGREVRLRGLAFFVVAPAPEEPFAVETDVARVRAVGTEFAVRSIRSESEATVVVRRGRVRLRAAGRGRRTARAVGPGEGGRVSDAGVAVERVDLERRLGWRDRRLAFDAAPLGEVIRELERWYRADFRLARPGLEGRRFTGEFAGESVARVAEVLSTALGVPYRLRDSAVVLGAPR